MAGSSMAKKSAAQQQAEAEQNAQIAELQQQQATTAAGAQYQAPPTYAQPTYAPPPAPEQVAAPAGAQDPIAMLKQLGELKAAGIVTDAEFEAKKAELLRQI